MRLCAALAVVLVALVVMTVRTIRRPHRHPPPVDRELVELAPAAPAPRPYLPTAAAPRPSSGIAHLRGRALLPAGHGSDGMHDLSVTADDGTRTFDARAMKGGRFAFHMPPGRYTLTAWADDLVGELRDVVVAADLEREVDIPLIPAASIVGQLHVPGNREVSVVARPMGSERPDKDGDALQSSFQIDGLIPGRRYDVEFTGSEIRTLKLVGVTAPTETLDVTLEPRAIVRVAVGFPAGETCPIDSVKVSAGSEAIEQERGLIAKVHDCRFELPAPIDAGQITVVAQGKGWLLQANATIPEHGDPEPVCLNPPCRANPLEGTANLRMTLEGGEMNSALSAMVVPVNDTDGSSHFCNSASARCDIEGLRAGETFTISPSPNNCRADPLTVTVVAGDNHVRIPCQRQRRIEGVIRIPEGQQPDAVVVRCAGGDSHPMDGTRLFRLTCDTDVAALEYQIGTQGTWRSIPIASLSNPAFVDIGSF